MPVLSSFISYRPKRKTKAPLQVSSPFPVKTYTAVSSPHPYASPRIIDINDGRLPAPSPNVPAPNSYYPTSTPRVELNVDINPEPLADWFPTNFLNPDPSSPKVSGEAAAAATGSGGYYGAGYNASNAGRVNGSYTAQEPKEESTSVEEEEEEGEEDLYTLSSAEEVLANLEAMDASNFVGSPRPDDIQLEPLQPAWKKPAPTPIKIPNASLHGPKVQLIRSSELSRPTSQISSPESSAISGTTLARALLANTFVLSGETRTSRYRSGASNLTRTDSATLPWGDFSLIHSPYWRDTLSVDLSLSPGSAPLEPVPPVPVNAEIVYVPPQTTRGTREKRRTSTGATAQPDRSPETGLSGRQQEADVARRISRITEDASSQLSTPELAYTLPEVVQERPKGPTAPPNPPPSDRVPSRRYSIRPGSEMSSEGVTSPLVSEAPSSAKDLDNVLDYYSFADTPEPTGERSFRPPFSPITEESTSQLSPPTPFRPDSRGSKRSLPPGRFFLGTTPSASIGGVRVDWNVRSSESRSSYRDSASKPLLPIRDRPGNQSSSTSSTHSRANASTSSFGTIHESTNNNLLPVPASSVFNRLRAGSAPSPIKVVRDSRDLTAYNITVTPRTAESIGSTPTTGDSDIVQQTFPETPSAFTPGFSPNGMASPGMRGSSALGDYMSMAVPQTPMSALLPAQGASIQPSLAQQVLLTRAATSVHGARHSRQASLTRIMRQQGHPYARPSSIVMNVTTAVEDASPIDNVASSGGIAVEAHEAPRGDVGAPTITMEHEMLQEVNPALVNGVNDQLATEKPVPEDISPSPHLAAPPQPAAYSQPNSPSEPRAPVLGTVSLPFTTPTPPTQTPLPDPPVPLADPPATPSSFSRGSEEAVLAYDRTDSGQGSVGESRAPSRAASKRSNASVDSPNSSNKILPRMPQSPRIPPPPKMAPPAPPAPPSESASVPTPEPTLGHGNEGPSSPNSSPIRPPATPLQTDASPLTRAEPLRTPTPISTPTMGTPLNVSQSPSARRPGMINPPLPHIQLPPAEPSANSLYSLYDAALSPPSYYAVINSDRAAGEAITPSTSGSYDPNYRFGAPYQPHSPQPNGSGEFVVGSSTDRVLPRGQGQPPNVNRRTRMRPPLPAGPRRPSQQHGPGILSGVKERGSSVSSIASQVPSGRKLQSAPLPSPRFQTATPKWRGYTMDAAKWTFTSTQLQGIVSRAIKQSSEASSIRLLRLETLDNEIPPELDRLQSLRTETKMKYKTQARKRTNLLESLANSVDGLDQDGLGHTLPIRMVEELKEVCGSMDKLTEELHSVDEQIAQLDQLCQGHSTSALAMALRKLNASFLKQFAEAQELRQQVEILEAERDEAWKEAQHVATDYEELRTGRIESPDTENRFDRVMAVRKSSIRATKAGLRSTTRSNQRGSLGSNHRGFGANTPSSGRTTFMDDLPPVPPIPRHRPVDILTNLPLRSSTVTGASTAGPTPNSETRALDRAQDELYDMLGIPVNDHRSRRTRSVIGLPGQSELAYQVTSPSYIHYDVPPNTGRRASLPESAALPPDPYNALTADVNIILNSDRAGWI